MKLVVLLALAGCTSHTAQIAASANDVRASAISAREHIAAADRELERIEAAAAQVHQQLADVSDDENPIFSTLKFMSVATVAVAVGVVAYKFKR